MLLPNQFESSARIYTLGKLGTDSLLDELTTEGMDFAIKSNQDEMVINKHTSSILIDTGFERILRNAGINTVVFTGIATDCTKVSATETARDGHVIPLTTP